ncbi:class I SAM-dependent methyltransferase [Actinoplanes sp. TRM 88003]|uniref:Class I SAM-dependent methyltransferase n=1 Tax=Paractinoplanes aksuensis TaxID=2939490 RepID=A0ABT1E661_9ACTN|nr:class I SAM-dependent methyltransferase [Actinoplanes aksuensis]
MEPSARIRAQRALDVAPALDAMAEQLPFDDDSFDAVMATVTVHQWADVGRGLSELRRVAREAVVVLTFDGDALDRLWPAEYVPELIAAERRRYPLIDYLSSIIGKRVDVREVPIPIDCVDGFTETYYARPEQFLDPRVRAAQSAWDFVDEQANHRAVEQLRAGLASGAWDARHGHLRTQPEFHGSLRLLAGQP